MHHALNGENISDLGEPDVANRVIKKRPTYCVIIQRAVH